MKRLLFGIGLIGAITVGLFAQAGGTADAKKMKNPIPSNPQSVLAGQMTFQKSCTVCHGPMGKGDGSIVPSLKPEATKPPNLTDDKWEHGGTDGEIFTTIRDGVAPKFEMKGQKGKLTDQEIWNVVNYIRTLGPKK